MVSFDSDSGKKYREVGEELVNYFVCISSKVLNMVRQKMLSLLCFHSKEGLELSPPRASSRTDCPSSDGPCPTRHLAACGELRLLCLSQPPCYTLVLLAALQAHPSYCGIAGFLSGALPVVLESCKKVKSLWRRCLSRQLERRKDFPSCSGGKTQGR